MALTRTMLKALGIESEKIEEIITAHAETVEALKAQSNEYKAKADKYDAAKTELDELKAKNTDDWKAKYDTEHTAFEAFKTEQGAKAEKAKKETAYREALKKSGVSENRFDAILKVTDFSKIELDKDGKLTKAEEIEAGIKEEWKDFIVSENQSGQNTPNPQKSGSVADYSKMDDTTYYRQLREKDKK